MKEDLKDENKEDWVVPMSPEAYTVANLMSNSDVKNHISIAVCVMAIEQLARMKEVNKSVPANVIKAVGKLHKKVQKLCK